MQGQDFDAVDSNSIHSCWWLCYNYRWYELICIFDLSAHLISSGTPFYNSLIIGWNCMRLQWHISLAWKKLIGYVPGQFKEGSFWGWAFMSQRLSDNSTVLRATRERSFSVGQSWAKRRWFCVMEISVSCQDCAFVGWTAEQYDPLQIFWRLHMRSMSLV